MENELNPPVSLTSSGSSLSELVRPKTLAQVIGQKHLINDHDGAIYNFLRLGYLPSMLLYGPPGLGKTTLASILAREGGYVYIELSATDSTIGDLKELLKLIVQENRSRSTKEEPLKVMVFIDEIHRFTTSQQDFLLPFVEEGSFVFIGATTVNPTTRIRRAVLSRCQLFELSPLTKQEVYLVIERAVDIENKRRSSKSMCVLKYSEECVQLVAKKSGDSRMAINLIELISTLHKEDNRRTEKPSVTLDVEVLALAIDSVRATQSGIMDKRNRTLVEKLFESMRNIEDGRRYTKYVPDLNSELDGVLEENNNGATSYDEAKLRSQEEPNIAEATSKESLVNSVDQDYFVDSFKSTPLIPDDPEYDILHQMQVSDDSDFEAGNMYDEEDTLLDANVSSLDKEQFFVVRSINFLNQLLSKGESPTFIGKQLLLFTANYLDNDSMAFAKVLSHLKGLLNTNLDPKRVLSDCVEWMTRQEKRDVPFDSILSLFKGVETSPCAASIENNIDLGVDYDPEIIARLAMEGPSIEEEDDQNPEFKVVPLELDTEVNI